MKKYAFSFSKTTLISVVRLCKTWGAYFLKLLFLSLLLSMPLWCMDYCLNWLGIYIQPHFHVDSFFLAVLLSLLLIHVKSNYFFYSIFVGLLLIIYIGFFHYLYFGRYFTGYDISLFFNEMQDTILEFSNDFWKYWQLLLSVIFGLLLMFCVRFSANRHIKQSNLFVVLIILSLMIIPIQNIKRGGEFIFPNSAQFMYYNGLKSISSYFIDVLISRKELKSFLPYQIELKHSSSEPMTIIYIMGESLSADHLSLFGYARKTTPYLEEWAKQQNFYYTRGVSGSTVTRNSIAAFINFQKEPENYTLVQSKEHNLFKLGKRADFSTTFMSAQTFSSFPHVGLEYVDYSFYKGKRNLPLILGDDFWQENLKSIPLSNKNFIVIQMRAIHSPYKKGWQHRFDDFNHFSGHPEDKIDDYDNGVLYVDSILNKTLEWAKDLPGKVYVFFASDHNELFGEYGIRGHITLHRQVARIPVFIWSNDTNFVRDFKSIINPSHWDIGEQILRLMGYEVNNPNTEKDIIFIQGSDPTGEAGFITLKKSGQELIEVH
ncbi:MAG: sulfatase-like hydrolase/transferase [Alphaproteobacteria bacterium]|nr:sulfatase-like hydrolase/transferase [Alphaproteobacteria bacterium]